MPRSVGLGLAEEAMPGKINKPVKTNSMCVAMYLHSRASKRRRIGGEPPLLSGRYEVKETTTKRPGFARPQNDEFSGEFGEGNQANDFGINQKFGGGGGGFPGPINGQFGPNPYGVNLAYPGGGAFPFQGGNPLGGGYFPGQQIGGGYGGGLGSYGAGGTGILVGPGGPTGIIGRPYPRFPHNGAGYHPGGSPYPYGGGFRNPAFGGQTGGFFPPGGYAPGGFYQQQQPFGPRPLGGFGGGPQFGPQFDQARQANKKVEKRAN
ncbi:hypothetical protein ZHAS_00011844 [Anopheles sinensis]|uniref:Uncharacterized protein n=1 Tax=Anopheles sinensis TaxID=74873 RepID=A0A084W1B9_ANOSI|nr:hypothetical protein ZHAS_00011844 [Anopheles sinensis]